MSFSLPKLIADTSTTSIRAVIQSAIVLFGVLGIQMFAFMLVGVLSMSGSRSWIDLLFILLSLLVVAATEIVAGYFCYVTTMNKIAAAAYDAGKEIVRGITEAAQNELRKKGVKNPTEYKSVAQVIDIGMFIQHTYQKIPVLVRYALEFFMSRVPAGALMTQALNAGTSEDESESAVNTVLEEYVLTHNTFGWLLWFVPITTIVQVVLIILQRQT